MATIKTIKPLGGGDYTNLQDWWAFAKTQATADQWAECYGGASLGALDTTGGATFTADATTYPKIYAVDGYLGGMSFDTSKPHIDDLVDEFAISLVNQPYFRVVGIQVRTVGFVAFFVSACGYVYIDSCLIISAATTGYGAYFQDNHIGPNYIQNCVAYNWGFHGFLCAGNSPTIINDCGVVDCGYGGAPTNAGIRINQFAGGDTTITNTYVLNTGGGACILPTTGTTMAKVFTSDTTGTDINTATSGQVVSLTSDWTTLNTSDFVGAGDDNLAVVPLDAMGHARTLPVWVGPYQRPASSVAAILAGRKRIYGARG